MRIFTLGHSNRTLGQLRDCLLAFNAGIVSDIRSYPRSGSNFQFNMESLERELPLIGVEYIWMGRGLGGYRRASKSGHKNIGWSSQAFRIYADYALSREFELALSELISLALKKVTVILCAERDPFRCHRQIIADYLLIRGWEVVHILEPGRSMNHWLTPFARVEGSLVTYPQRYRESRLYEFALDSDE